MLICIDYDGTYTKFPEILDKVIILFTEAKHEVICATMRYSHETTDKLIELRAQISWVYYTGRKAKLPYLAALGIFPDLWIEDKPEWLYTNAL